MKILHFQTTSNFPWFELFFYESFVFWNTNMPIFTNVHSCLQFNKYVVILTPSAFFSEIAKANVFFIFNQKT